MKIFRLYFSHILKNSSNFNFKSKKFLPYFWNYSRAGSFCLEFRESIQILRSRAWKSKIVSNHFRFSKIVFFSLFEKIGSLWKSVDLFQCFLSPLDMLLLRVPESLANMSWFPASRRPCYHAFHHFVFESSLIF